MKNRAIRSAMEGPFLHVSVVYLLCGTICGVVYLLKWPSSNWEETESNHIFYSFWQLLGLIANMLLTSFALFMCLAYDARRNHVLELSVNHRRVMAAVGMMNIVGASVNVSSLLGRSMVATFLLPPNDQLSLYILPLSVSVIQIIVTVILLVELISISITVTNVESPSDVKTALSFVNDALANHDVPYVIIFPDSSVKDVKEDDEDTKKIPL